MGNAARCISTSRRSVFNPVRDQQVQPGDKIGWSPVEFVPSERQAVEQLKKTQDGLDMTITCYSQRGFYPDALDYPNQDAWSVTSAKLDPSPDEESSHLLNALSTRDVTILSVFDGHNSDGAVAAAFIKDNLPEAIVRFVSLCTDPRLIERALAVAYYETNEKLIKQKNVSKMSGSTAITVVMINKRIYVCNVGNCRAAMLTRSYNGVDAFKMVQLSNDHTPMRQDERERVRDCGARIMTSMSVELGLKEKKNFDWDSARDNEIPRVWAPTAKFPGSMYTRSFGDKASMHIGITASPEVEKRDLARSDKYLLIASDGLFQYLPNETVSLIIQANDDPHNACKEMISAASEKWLAAEGIVDDITVMLVKLEW